MSERDVPAADWRDFLAEFSRGHRAWLATVDRTPHPGVPPHVEAVERPLASVTPDVRPEGIVGIEIRFREDSHAHPIRIDAPTRMAVEETQAGTARGLSIWDRSGDCTRVRFRAAPPPEMLDGIAPGELSP